MLAHSRRRFAAPLLVGIALLLLLESGWAAPAGPSVCALHLTPVVNSSRQLAAPPVPGGSSQPGGEISEASLATAGTLSAQAVDWLGPAAPLALSPFFGMTLLSGLAIWGPEWMPARGWLDAAGPLNNPWVFWIFLVLSLLTSLPRFMKVTKPLAQLAEQAETYSVLVMLFVVRFLASPAAEPVAACAIPETGIMAGGMAQMTTEMLLYVALVVNVIVINGVKVCFELLIWMSPVPFIDAIFESANKAVCAALMTLYAFSPLLATILNLVLFVAAAVVFRWVSRISNFYRAILMDYAKATLFGRKWKPGTQPILCFASNAWPGIAPRSRMVFYRLEKGWAASPVGWFFNGRETGFPDSGYQLQIVPGLLTSDLILTDSQGKRLVLVVTRYYAESIPELAQLLCARVASLPAGKPAPA